MRASMVDVFVSTIGPSAETVTCSWTVPTGSTRSIVTTAAGETSIPSCTAVLKESLDAVRRYRPTGRFRNTYDPFSDVVADRVPESSAGLAITTVVPGRTTPSSLFTTPVTLPSWTACAWRDPGAQADKEEERRRGQGHPFQLHGRSSLFLGRMGCVRLGDAPF